MTRKEELKARARDYVSLFVMSGAEPAATKNLAWILMEVEREVWERATIGYAQWINGEDKEDYPRFEDWLIAQQQELA